MIRFLSLFVVLLVFSPAVMAQEDADVVLGEQQLAADVEADMDAIEEDADKPIQPLKDDDYQERLKLSRKMHEIWPMRPKVENVLDNVAEQIEPQNRLRFKTAMRKSIKFDALEQASIDAMADIYTVKELEAMIAFYGSKEGRSVSYKTDDYERAIEPTLTKMIDKALLDVKLGSQ